MTITTKNFTTKLASVTNRTGTLRADIQALIEFGLEHVKGESGNTVYLTKVLNACKTTGSLPTNAMKEYIKCHCTNLMYGKDKSGNFVFKKAVKGEEYVVTAPTQPWWEHDTAKKVQAKSDFDAVARAKVLLTNLTKSLKEGKVKDEAQAKAIQAALATALEA